MKSVWGSATARQAIDFEALRISDDYYLDSGCPAFFWDTDHHTEGQNQKRKQVQGHEWGPALSLKDPIPQKGLG